MYCISGVLNEILSGCLYILIGLIYMGTDDSLALLTMQDVIARYNTKVMVCEAVYLYN